MYQCREKIESAIDRQRFLRPQLSDSPFIITDFAFLPSSSPLSLSLYIPLCPLDVTPFLFNAPRILPSLIVKIIEGMHLA